MKSAKKLTRTLIVSTVTVSMVACSGKKADDQADQKATPNANLVRLQETNKKLEESNRRLQDLVAGLKKDKKDAVKAAVEKVESEKEDEIAALQRQLEETNSNPPEASTQQVREWARAQAKWARDKSDLTKKIKILKKERDSLRQIIAQKESVEAQMQILADKFAATESKLDESLPEIAAMVQRAKELEAERDSIKDLLNQHIKKHEEDIAAAQQAADEAVATANQAQVEIGTLNETVNGVKGQVAEIAEKMKTIETPAELAGVGQRLANMREALDRVDNGQNEKMAAADAKMAELQEKIKKLKILSDGSGDLKGFSSEASEINSGLADLQSQLDGVATDSSKKEDGATDSSSLAASAIPAPGAIVDKGQKANGKKANGKKGKPGASASADQASIPSNNLEDTAATISVDGDSESTASAAESSADSVAADTDSADAAEGTSASGDQDFETQSAAPTASLDGKLGSADQNVLDQISNKSIRPSANSEEAQAEALQKGNKALVDDLMSKLRKVKEALDAKKGNLKDLRAKRDQIVAELEAAGAEMSAVRSSVIEKINSDPKLLEEFQAILAAQEENLAKLEGDSDLKDKELVFLLTVFGESNDAEIKSLEDQLQKQSEEKPLEIINSNVYLADDSAKATARVRLLVRSKYNDLKTVAEELNKSKSGRLTARIHPLLALRADVYLTVVRNMKNVDEEPVRILVASTTQFGAEDFVSAEEIAAIAAEPQTLLALDKECAQLDEGCAKALTEADRGIVNLSGEGLPKLAAKSLKELACRATQATNQLKSVSEGKDVGVNAENLVSQLALTTEIYAARAKGDAKDVEKSELSSDEPSQYTSEDVEILEEDASARDVLATPSMLLTNFPAQRIEVAEAADLSGAIDKTKADEALQKMKDQKSSGFIKTLFDKLGGCGTE